MCWITHTACGGGFKLTAIKQQAPTAGVSAQILRSDPTDESKVFDCVSDA
ncbi:hypothetical protein ACEZCY_04020 [Streptacidiphilus sp. N1-12]|uniref:Uncharacterized protein n=2 Tax=Streptacidiphilus alkalitolerans TaxID=3342712 RepID=A0ABV6V3Z7_9ACTN